MHTYSHNPSSHLTQSQCAAAEHSAAADDMRALHAQLTFRRLALMFRGWKRVAKGAALRRQLAAMGLRHTSRRRKLGTREVNDASANALVLASAAAGNADAAAAVADAAGDDTVLRLSFGAWQAHTNREATKRRFRKDVGVLQQRMTALAQTVEDKHAEDDELLFKAHKMRQSIAQMYAQRDREHARTHDVFSPAIVTATLRRIESAVAIIDTHACENMYMLADSR
jgi:hypothetical protein